MIPEYDKKKVWLYKKQFGRCAATGTLLVHCDKTDLHHRLANTKLNRRLYPNFLSSVWNLSLVWHSAHITKVLPKHPAYWRINLAEGLLQGRPDLAYTVEMNEAINLYCEGIG